MSTRSSKSSATTALKAALSTTWTLNPSNCVIPDIFSGYSDIFVWNVNKARFLTKGAKHLNDTIHTTAGDYIAMGHQLFFEFGHNVFNEVQKYIRLLSEHSPQTPMDTDIVCFLVENVLGDRRLLYPHELTPDLLLFENRANQKKQVEYTDLTFWILFKRPEIPDAIRLLMKGLTHGDNNNNNNNNDNNSQETDFDEEPDGDLLDELGNIVKGTAPKPKPKKAKKPKIKDSEMPCLNPNIIWSRLVHQTIESHQSTPKSRSNAKPATDAALKHSKPYEKWKSLKSLDDLVLMYDFYTGRAIASNAVSESIASKPLSHSGNVLSATSLFSVLSAALARDTRCCKKQSAHALLTDTTQFENAKWTIRFPLRKYVTFISQLEFQSQSLYNRVLPWFQKTQEDRMGAGLSKILADVQNNRDIFSKFKVDETSPSATLSADDVIKIDATGNGTYKLAPANNTIDESNPQYQQYKRSFEKVATKLGLSPLFNPNVVSFDTEEFQRVGGKNLASYLYPIVQNYISAYSPIEEFYRTVHKSYIRICSDMRLGKLGIPIKSWKTVAAKLRKMWQNYALREYQEKCRSAESDIGDPGVAIHVNGIQNGRIYERAKEICHVKVDSSISQYGNYEIQQYIKTSKVYCIAAVVPNILATQYSLSVSNHSTGDARLNFAAISPSGGNGKSHALKFLKENCIEGTVAEITYESDKSDSSHKTYAGHWIYIQQEADLTLLTDPEHNKKSKGGEAGERERKFKEKLTSGRNTYKVVVIDEEGNRKTEVHTTICPSVFFIASNANLRELMSEAMRSRWHLASYEDTVSSGDINELKCFAELLDESEKDIRETGVVEHHIVQALVFELENLFFFGAVEFPSVHVANIMLLLLMKGLNERGLSRACTRDLVKTTTLARIKCMISAICDVFFFKGAPHNGKEIKVEYLLDIERRLFVTEQHVVSAIGEQIDMYVDVLEADVLAIFRAYWLSLAQERREFKTESRQVHEEGSGKRIARKEAGWGQNETHTVTVSTFDYNYIRIRGGGTLDSFCERVRQMGLVLAEDTRNRRNFAIENGGTVNSFEASEKDVLNVPSVFAINTVLREWHARTIYCHSYVGNIKKAVFVDPTVPGRSSKPILQYDNRFVYLNYEFVNSSPQIRPVDMWGCPLDTPPQTNALASLSNASMRGTDSRIIVENSNSSTASTASTTITNTSSTRGAVSPRINRNGFGQIDSKTQMLGVEAVEEILRDILCKKFQRPQRLLFTVNTRLGYIRNVIDITKEDIGTTGNLFIPSPVHLDKVSSMILQDAVAYLDEFRKAEGLLIDIDFSTYSMRIRNEVLKVTKEVVSPSYRSIELFTSPSNSDNDFDSLQMPASSSEDEPNADMKEIDEDDKYLELTGIRTNKGYDKHACGYFLGHSIEEKRDMKTIARQHDLDEKIKKIYRQLDVRATIQEALDFQEGNALEREDDEEMDDVERDPRHMTDRQYLKWFKEQLRLESYRPHLCQLEDEDFKRDDFIVRPAQYDPKSGEMVTPPLYHWQMSHMVPALRNNARAYKLVCYHPFIVDDLANQRHYMNTETNWYPHRAIREHDEAIVERRQRELQVNQSDSALVQAIEEGRVYLPGSSNGDYDFMNSVFGNDSINDIMQVERQRLADEGLKRKRISANPDTDTGSIEIVQVPKRRLLKINNVPPRGSMRTTYEYNSDETPVDSSEMLARRNSPSIQTGTNSTTALIEYPDAEKRNTTLDTHEDSDSSRSLDNESFRTTTIDDDIPSVHGNVNFRNIIRNVKKAVKRGRTRSATIGPVPIVPFSEQL